MNKIVAVISLVILSGVVSAFAVPATLPVVFFSDISSGPNSGGKDNNGVFVTVVGKNFGSSRGMSFVTVGGGRAADYPVWTDSKISFQLGPLAKPGDVTVTTAAGTSNGVHFLVRGGRILFVNASSPGNPGSGTFADPWRSPRSYFTAQQPGDTCYFRAGLYNGQYGNTSRPYNVSFYNSGIPSGSAGNEIAWVGYPGEIALFKADDNTVYNGAFELNGNNQYFVIAGLSIYGRGDGREQVRLYSDNDKLVNCQIEGIKTLSYGMIGVTASNIKIWGNEMSGATSGNKLDHIVYFQDSGGDISNIDVGWNYIHDNNIAVGPIFSWNRPGKQSNNINIHDNRIDCRNSSDIVRLAGIWNGAGGAITFVNNIIIGAGGALNNDDSYNAIYAGFGNITVYNNTFYLSHGAGSSYVINVFGSAFAEVKNNIFYNQKDISYVKGNAQVDSNLYFGGSGNLPPGDAHPIVADPQFINPPALDLHIADASPANGKGTDTSSLAARDFDGVARVPGSIAIGAYQYYTGEYSSAGGTTTTTTTTGAGNGVNIPMTVQVVSPGQVKVVGSTANKGVVNPRMGETAKIYFQGSGNGTFECRIFTIAGDQVWESSMANVQGGFFEWAPTSVASGVYLANVKGPGVNATQKIAVIQ